MNTSPLTDEELNIAFEKSRQDLMSLARRNTRYRDNRLWTPLFKSYFPNNRIKCESNVYELFCYYFKLALSSARQNGFSLADVSDAFVADKELMLASVRRDGATLKYASVQLKKDKDVVLAAVTRDGSSLIYASDELKQDIVVVLAAVCQFGMAINYASIQPNQKQELLQIKLIKNKAKKINACSEYYCKYFNLQNFDDHYDHCLDHPWAFQFMPRSSRDDKAMVEMILNKDGCMIKFVEGKDKYNPINKYKRDNKKYILMAVNQTPDAINSIPSAWRYDDDVLMLKRIYDRGERQEKFESLVKPKKACKKESVSGEYNSIDENNSEISMIQQFLNKHREIRDSELMPFFRKSTVKSYNASEYQLTVIVKHALHDGKNNRSLKTLNALGWLQGKKVCDNAPQIVKIAFRSAEKI